MVGRVRIRVGPWIRICERSAGTWFAAEIAAARPRWFQPWSRGWPVGNCRSFPSGRILDTPKLLLSAGNRGIWIDCHPSHGARLVGRSRISARLYALLTVQPVLAQLTTLSVFAPWFFLAVGRNLDAICQRRQQEANADATQ